MIQTFFKYYGLYQRIEVRWKALIFLFSPPRANQLGGPLKRHIRWIPESICPRVIPTGLLNLVAQDWSHPQAYEA
jgi:hypothetical protein